MTDSMTFTAAAWTGDWISFEQLINSRDPDINRAWEESETAMRAHWSAFSIMLPFFGGSIRRFWRWACRTTGRENRYATIAGWQIEPLEFGNNPENGFALAWMSEENTVIGRYAYQFDHMIDKGLEGKPCYIFHADSAPIDSPFRVLIAMDPMPARTELENGGLLSHLHFQYGSSEDVLLKQAQGKPSETAKIRHRMWYPTMCDARGDTLAQCNIIRALHHLPAWDQLPSAQG